jgi:hypothetical protein
VFVYLYPALPADAPNPEHPEPAKKSRFKAGRDSGKQAAAAKQQKTNTQKLDPEEIIDSNFVFA